jgi:hypothetical protein
LGDDQKEAGRVRDTEDRRRRKTTLHRTLWWDSGAELESDIDSRCGRRALHVIAGLVGGMTSQTLRVLLEMLKDQAL